MFSTHLARVTICFYGKIQKYLRVKKGTLVQELENQTVLIKFECMDVLCFVLPQGFYKSPSLFWISLPHCFQIYHLLYVSFHNPPAISRWYERSLTWFLRAYHNNHIITSSIIITWIIHYFNHLLFYLPYQTIWKFKCRAFGLVHHYYLHDIA